MYGSTRQLITVKDRGEHTHYVTDGDGETSPLIVDHEQSKMKTEDLALTDIKTGEAEGAIDPLEEDDLSTFRERETLSFHQAARYGNAAVVKKYLLKYRSQAKKVNKLDKYEWSALHYAVRYGNMDVIQLLLHDVADVNTTGADGVQPIHVAAKYFKSEKHLNDSSTAETLRKLSTTGMVALAAVKFGKQSVAGAEKKDENFVEDMAEFNQFLNLDAALKPPDDGDHVDDVITYLLRQGADVNSLDNYSQSPLHYASKKGNMEALVLLIRWPTIDLNVTDTGGGSALHSACYGSGQPDAVRLLLMAGTKLMVWDNENQTPLHHAASADKGDKILNEVELHCQRNSGTIDDWKLIDMFNNQDDRGQTVLHLAIEAGNYKSCDAAIKNGAKVNLCRENFTSPLHLAAIGGDLEIVKLLVSHGANKEATNLSMETPLHKASKYHRIKVMEYLTDSGCNVNATDQNNKTPLILASAYVSPDAVRAVNVLLDHHADITLTDSAEKTAIYWAAEERSLDVLKVLLDKVKKNPKLQFLVDCTDRMDNTPLHIAAQKGYRQIVHLLLEHDANVDSVNDEDLTPLHLAVIKGNQKVAVSLLRKQENMINDHDESGNTALHLAASNGHVELIDILIDFGADVDAKNIMISTPLVSASSKGHAACCMRLLERDGEINSSDLASMTPLHVACREGFVSVVRVLLQYGADVSLLDHEGHNALNLAIENTHRDVIMELLNHEDWLLSVKNRSVEGKTITTPMRQLIQKLPDIAYLLLNKCLKFREDMDADCEDFQVKFFYELIDDTYADWYNEINGGDDTKSLTTSASLEDFTEDDDNANKLTSKIIEIMEKKESHPLLIMVENECDNLLRHPLCVSLIYEKWQSFGRVVFYAKFLVYFIFLLFFTGHILVSTPIIPRDDKVNGSDQCVPKADHHHRKDTSIIIFFIGGRFIILGLCVFQLILEVPQMMALKLKYLLDLENLLEWVIYCAAIIYAWPNFDDLVVGDLGGIHCTSHVSIGALGIVCAWINLLLYLQKFPIIGIYVVMFLDITNTFLKFSIVFLLFIFSFAVGFFTLMYDQAPLTYLTIWRTMVKTLVMLIGEYDFDDAFNGDDDPPPLITWFLFVIFIVVMTILLSNLLVGLAVDDISAVLDQAVMSKISSQVHLVLDVEKTIPRKYRMNFLRTDKVVWPNKKSKWYTSILSSHVTKMDEIEAAVRPKKTVTDIVQEQTLAIHDTVEKLKENSRDVTKKLKSMERMMQKVLKASNVNEFDDDDDD